jgi:uncharacterized protein
VNAPVPGIGLGAKVSRLRTLLQSMQTVVVAYSGGVDSALLLAVAAEELGDGVVALTAHSPSMPRAEAEAAQQLANDLGVRTVVIQSREMDDPRYRANPTNRCYFCKSELYDLALEHAQELGIEWVLDGTNADDLGDHRPGRLAASHRGVRSPLAEVGLTKAEIRILSQDRGLPTWNKPAAPCLASRIPYGTEVTPERLMQIERAEQAVRKLGFQVFRVRYHGDVARLEIAEDELPTALTPEMRQRLSREVQAAGFRFVALDLAGFRSGSLNIIEP